MQVAIVIRDLGPRTEGTLTALRTAVSVLSAQIMRQAGRQDTYLPVTPPAQPANRVESRTQRSFADNNLA